MKHKDLFAEKVKEAMIEESKGMKLSQDLVDKIISKREKTWRERLNEFLNKEIEIHVVPVLVGIIGIFVVTIIPKEIFSQSNVRIIDIGTSRIIVRDVNEVANNED